MGLCQLNLQGQWRHLGSCLHGHLRYQGQDLGSKGGIIIQRPCASPPGRLPLRHEEGCGQQVSPGGLAVERGAGPAAVQKRGLGGREQTGLLGQPSESGEPLGAVAQQRLLRPLLAAHETAHVGRQGRHRRGNRPTRRGGREFVEGWSRGPAHSRAIG